MAVTRPDVAIVSAEVAPVPALLEAEPTGVQASADIEFA